MRKKIACQKLSATYGPMSAHIPLGNYDNIKTYSGCGSCLRILKSLHYLFIDHVRHVGGNLTRHIPIHFIVQFVHITK